MSMRLIDDSKWYEFHTEKTKDIKPYDHYDTGFEDGMDVADQWIDEQPTIDPTKAGVVHGQWKTMYYEGGILDGMYSDRCSCCNWERVFRDARLKVPFLFCPGCGAKMDGGDDHAVD